MSADRQGVARPDLAAARLYTAVVSDILDGLGHRVSQEGVVLPPIHAVQIDGFPV